MGWNYRVFNEVKQNCNHYTIREVYYEANNSNNLTGYTAKPIRPESFWEDEDSTPIEDLRWQLEKMLKALDKNVLTEQDFNAAT